MPPDAALVLDGDVQGPPRRPMARSLEDPTFAGRVESVESDLAYRVEFDGRTTPRLPRPRLRVSRAQAAPTLTSSSRLTRRSSPKVVEDIRHVTAVEGTELTLICRLNKDVASASLLDKEGQAVALVRDECQPHTYRAKMTLADPQRYTVKLVDPEGRANQLEPEIVVNVTRNRPPTVTLTQPAHDVEVSPLEELKLKARMDDDFGLVRHGLSYAIGGHEPQEIVFASPSRQRPARTPAAAQARGRAHARLRGDQGRRPTSSSPISSGPRTSARTASRGVRRATCSSPRSGQFEEIFRQGEQPPGGSAENEEQQEGQNAQEAGQLAELQKQIINGTWKLIRRETRAKPTDAVRRGRQDPPRVAARRPSSRRPSSASGCATRPRRRASNRPTAS